MGALFSRKWLASMMLAAIPVSTWALDCNEPSGGIGLGSALMDTNAGRGHDRGRRERIRCWNPLMVRACHARQEVDARGNFRGN